MSNIPDGFEEVIPEGFEEVKEGAQAPSSLHNEIPSGIDANGNLIYPSKYPDSKKEISKESPGLLDFLMGAPRKGHEQSKVAEVARKGLGVLEAGANLGSGIAAQIPAALNTVNNMAGTATNILSGMSQEELAKREKPEQIFQRTLEDFTYQPRTESGQDIAQDVGKVINDFGIPMGAVAHTVPFYKPDVKTVMGRVGELARREPVPEIPKGFEEVPKQELQQQLSLEDQGSMAPQYGVRQSEGHWVTDENSMPVRADLSMEAQNLENPLQRNLWGDELPTKSPQEGTPLTEAIDSMSPEQRSAAIKDQLSWEVPASGELEAAMAQANGGMELGKPGEFRTSETGLEFGDQNYPARGPNGGSITTRRLVDEMKNTVDPAPIKGTDKVAIKPTAEDHFINKVPGMDKATKDWIPDDTPVADVKAAVLSEGAEAGKLRFGNLRSGAQMTAVQRNSALIQAAGRYILNGVKRAERNTKLIVEPFEKQMFKLDSAEVSKLAQVMKDEMFSRELNKNIEMEGLSKKAIEAYNEARTMFSKALDEMNAARTEMGMKPVTAREAYLSSRWQGSFRIPVYGKDGKLLWYIAETSRRQANKALQYLIDKGVEVDLKRSKMEPITQSMRSTDPFEHSYLTMLEMLDPKDPRTDVVKSIGEDWLSKDGFDTLNQKVHFENKANIRGFIGDREWRNNEKAEAYAMFKQQVQYAKNAFKWAESQKAVSKIKELIADPEIQELQPSNAEYVRQYTKNHLGYGEAPIVRAIEKWVSDKVGIDKSHAYDAVGIAKGLFLTQKLALNFGYYLSQGLQMFNSIPEHSFWTGRGFKHSPLETFAKAQQDMAAATASHALDMVAGKKMEPVPYSKIGKDAWDYMEQNGIANRNIMDEAQGLGQHKVAQSVKRVADYPIAKSEQIIRAETFLQFAHHFEQSKKFSSLKEIFQRAEEATDLAMVNFRREERAMVFSQFGVLGRAGETLKSYLMWYYNTLGRYGKEATQGNVKPLLWFLGMQGAIYGVMNLPGATEVNDAWDKIKQMVPDNVYEKIKDMDMKKFMIDKMGDWSYGGASKLTGANLSTRGNIALDQSFALDGMFPFATDLYKQGKAVAQAAVNPNTTTLAQAAYQLAPSGPIQNRIAQSKAFQVGEQRSDGTQVFQKPTRLGEHEYDYARTPEQVDMKNKYGLTSLEEAKYKDLNRLNNEDASELSNRRQKLVDKTWDAIVRGDASDRDTYVKRYINFDGDPDQLVNGLVTQAYRMNVSREQLQLIQQSNIPVLKKIAALQQLVGRIK